MSDDAVSREDQAAISRLAQGALQQIAAGRTTAEVSRDLQANGLAKSTADGLAEHLQQQWVEIAAAPRANAAAYFTAKFPEMRPVRSTPSLFTMHGIGTTLCGRRDLDAATGTYVKTHSLCVLFVPVLALAAYRIAPSGSGWTLIGRVPLSRFARWWNILFPLAIAAAIGLGIWDAEQHSPTAVAARKLVEADAAASAGKLVVASRLYGEVASGRTEHSAAAREKCAKLIQRPELETMPLAEVTLIFDNARQCMGGGNPLEDVLARGLAIVKLRAQADPEAAVGLLCHLAVLSHDKTCGVFAELFGGPLAALSPAETVAVFRKAAEIPQDAADQATFAKVATKQSTRLAATDLPSAFDLLSIAASQGGPASVDKCLTNLLAGPFENASCTAVLKSLQIGRGFVGHEGGKQLFAAGMAWFSRHSQTDPKDLLALLDQLGELEEADPSRIAAGRRPLLEKLVAASPKDVDLTVQLALAIEAEGQAPGSGRTARQEPAEQIIKLLSPLRDKLAAGEGARALGQALAAQGKYDDSYALLGPYLDQRLDAFHAAEEAYKNAEEQVESRVANQFRTGTAPGFNFARARQVSEKEFQAMALEYLSRQLKDDANVNSARDTLTRQAMVVPAALDLGMVILQRAQAMKDPAARRAELERAEKTFLAIRGTAGEADQYLLHLGQVYYWLGKQKEGQDEFDKLLAKHQRKAEMLYAVASVLRELGAQIEARKLLEEAFEKAPDAKMKGAAAHLRAISAKDLDDEIVWLERCDADNYEVKALLAKSRGQRAEIQGKDDEAAADFRESAAIYEKQPASASTLNNGALCYLQLFEVSGDRQALDRASQWLEKAVSLSPSDSLVLSNAASEMLRAAVQDLAGARLNLRELQMSGHLSALYFLAADQQGLDEIRRRASEHAGLRKGLSYLERAIVLSPKSQGNNVMALEYYGFLRDRDALQRLAARVAVAKPDAQEQLADSLKYYQYKDDATTKDALNSRVNRAQALVSRLALGAKGVEYAAAVDGLVDLKLVLPDNESGADELVRLAEEAHRESSSLPTYGTLIRALMHRAGVKLAADYPAYEKATRGTGRAVAANYAVVLAFARNDALGKAARENQDAQRAVTLATERLKAYPESRDLWDWAALEAAQPRQDKLRAQCLDVDSLNKIMQEIGRTLTPYNPHEALEIYWQRRAAGDASAREPLDELVKLGVPLPLGLIQP